MYDPPHRLILVAVLLLEEPVGSRGLICGQERRLVQCCDDDQPVIPVHQLWLDPGRDVLTAHDMGACPTTEHMAPVQESELDLVIAEMPLCNALLEMCCFAVVRDSRWIAVICMFHA